MDRATKLIVLVAACAMAFWQAWLLQGAWPRFPLIAVLAFAAAAVCISIDRRAVAFLLAPAYLLPTLLKSFHGSYDFNFLVLWTAALLGAVAPDTVRTGWHLPGRWRPAIVCWSFISIVSALLAIAREADFYPHAYFTTYMMGGGPAFVSLWVLNVCVILLVGLLWFDWLFGARAFDVQSWIIAPLAISAAIAASMAVYDAAVRFPWLAGEAGESIGRRSGGPVFDPNIMGAIAALWIAGAAFLILRFSSWKMLAGVLGLGLGWAAVWVSGSRTAFASALAVTAFSFVGLWARRDRSRPFRSLLMPAVLMVGLAVLVLLISRSNVVVGPLQRERQVIQTWTMPAVKKAAYALWTRDRYGTMSVAMIREQPWFGVGLGGYHILLSYYALRVENFDLTPDNAQNWYRQQLAEFGLIGSVGWIAWTVAFAWFVVRRRPQLPPQAWPARGALVGFALISLLGIPGQHILVSITFWTLAFWYASMSGDARMPSPVSGRMVAAIVAVSVVYAAGAARAFAGPLRPVVRAQEVNWPYSYGFSAVERDQGGNEYRWAEPRAVTLVDATGPWLELTVWAPRASQATPVDVKVWCGDALVLKGRFSTADPVTSYARMPEGMKRVIIESRASRGFEQPTGSGSGRNVSLQVAWKFVQGPAPGVVVHP